MKNPRRYLSLAAIALAAGCGAASEPSEPVSPVSGAGSYSVSMSGDVRTSLQGVPVELTEAAGYKEADPSGHLQSTPVVLIQMIATDATQPTLFVGLLGPIQVGTYTVRVLQSAVGLGTRPEFYAVITQPGTDGRRSYAATSGTITVTAVGETLRGTFALHFGTVAFFPGNPPSDMSNRVVGASVDASGSFAAAAGTPFP